MRIKIHQSLKCPIVNNKPFDKTIKSVKIAEKMGDQARGDCKKVTGSSEEEDVFQNNSFLLPVCAVHMMSQLNLREKRPSLPGTSGEAPSPPTQPVVDDTDLQFWAEDELSSSESRNHFTSRRKRRHSLAYRNRVAVRRRSKSLLHQSSSSSSDPIRLKIPPPALRRRKCHRGQGPSATKKPRGASNASALRTSVPQASPTTRMASPSTARNNSYPRNQHLMLRRRSVRRRVQTTATSCNCNTLPNNDYQNNNKERAPKPRPPFKSKRK